MDNKFKFYIPADIEKGVSSSGQEEMRIRGIGSDSKRDKEGEFLDPSGFDLSEFRWINWNHLGKSDAATIIGEPDNAKCKITSNNEFYFEGILYPELPMAKSAYVLMQALRKSPSGNKLSLSVEGKVTLRDPKNPKRILKSKITAIAICPTPVNANTWVDLIEKGITGKEDKEEEYDEETKKAMEAEGSVTSKESVEHNPKDVTRKVLRKSDIYERIFAEYPSIDIEKAKSVYLLIEKIATMEKEAKTVSEETIKKSFEILNIASEEIEKAEKKEEIKEEKKKEKKEGEDEDESKEMTEKASGYAKGMKKSGDAKEAMKEKLLKKGFSEEVVNKAIEKAENDKEEKVEASVIIKSEDTKELQDLIKSQIKSSDQKFQALGEILKSQSEENGELKKSLETVLDENKTLKEDIQKALSQPLGRKSAVKSFSEKFEKSKDGEAIYNINSKADVKALKDKIEDLAGINKGDGNFDMGLMRIAQDLELTKSITPQALQKLKGYEIRVVQA